MSAVDVSVFIVRTVIRSVWLACCAIGRLHAAHITPSIHDTTRSFGESPCIVHVQRQKRHQNSQKSTALMGHSDARNVNLRNVGMGDEVMRIGHGAVAHFACRAVSTLIYFSDL